MTGMFVYRLRLETTRLGALKLGISARLWLGLGLGLKAGACELGRG